MFIGLCPNLRSNPCRLTRAMHTLLRFDPGSLCPLRCGLANARVHAAFSAESVGCLYTPAFGGWIAQKSAFCRSFPRFFGLMEQLVTGMERFTQFRRRLFLQFVEFRLMTFLHEE